MSKVKLTIERLRELLSSGVVKFYFQKTNGELREAYGTTKLDEIPFDKRPRGGNAPNGTVPFFCIQTQEWRSVSIRSEIWGG